MSALFRIVYAAHANGTHHKLALDALRHMRRSDADAWQRMFLKHVDLYLEGSKAPDTSFKDFKNHVLHVGDKYWGGAPEKVEAWYGHLVTALRAEKWSDAAYAAGVLSHYYTDPIHPFHTAQTEAENSIHRAVEWSINRSYNSLRALAEASFADLQVPVPDGTLWLREMVCDGAEYSNRYYEKLIAHYDIHVGTVRPEEGLDAISRTCVAELLFYAADGFAHILDRAITEANIAPPVVDLTLATVLAGLKIPQKWIEKRLTNAADRTIVQAMYDELRATGKVEHSLPEDDRTIRDLHAREVLAPQRKAQDAARATRVPNGDPADVRARSAANDAAKHPIKPAALAAGPHDGPHAAAPPKKIVAPSAPPLVDPAPAVTAPQSTITPSPQPPAKSTSVSVPQVATLPQRPSPSEQRRSYLAASDPLEAAPSIGPKMAQTFADLGILTVADFLGQNPSDMAELLDDTRFDSEVLTDWQDQAQLVIEIAGLRGTHAQLLVGAGYRTADAIRDADAAELSADVLTFAATADGKRVLRDGHPPDLEKIRGWVALANESAAA